MPSDREIIVDGVLGQAPVILKIEMPVSNISNFAIYAPAIPGVIVAVAGLWIVHLFTRSRDRRKEISDACSELSKSVDTAADTAIKTWLEDDAAKRTTLIYETKRKLQLAGSLATNLKKRSSYGRFIFGIGALFRYTKTIDVLPAISRLRSAATDDPFDDQTRKADQAKANDVAAATAEVQAAIAQGYADLYRLN